MKNRYFKKILSFVLCLALVLTSLPIYNTVTAKAATGTTYTKVVDANTMNGWTKYFDLENLTTVNAGGVWTDKSVFSDATAFPGTGIALIDSNRNFLTALSALAASKEIVGYSTLPTDTVLVLDVSNSMQGKEADLVESANAAIDKLLSTNKNNRVGVVVYSSQQLSGTSNYNSSVVRLLPIDRYTESNGEYLVLSGNSYSGRTISVNNSVRIEGQNGDPHLDNSKKVDNCTYIQAGLWEAMTMFLEMDTVVTGDNWQEDENRMPILVLMSDGAPTIGTSNYDNVGAANVGNGIDRNMTTGQGFLVQLTASYVINRIQNHYKTTENQIRSLFYTLGFNVSGTGTANQIARSVLNPDGYTITDEYWATYSRLTTGDMMVPVTSSRGSSTQVAIEKNSYVTSKSYVDEYFSADGDGLTTAFDDIVEEIILQSRYYPTHLEGGNPDFSGYVEFTDILGDYMEVKEIEGILLGDRLYTGAAMAGVQIYNVVTQGSGVTYQFTELGNEVVNAVKERLGIVSTADAQSIIIRAINAGQLKYISATEWSNYIGWYAKADGTYYGFMDENAVAPSVTDARYEIKSYGFLGETTGSIKNSDMMYMSVEVITDRETGSQTVSWKIPASLVPMVTYMVTLDGNNVGNATNVSIHVDSLGSIAPIRLIYETGLRSDINEFNVTDITDGDHVAEDGHTREFWNNFFDISAASHDQHITTISEFTPNQENERFYYTFDSTVLKKTGDTYELVGEGETLNPDGEYYHRRYIFTEGRTTPQFVYERMSKASIQEAIDNGWQADFMTLEGVSTGAWVVPAGTPARELQMYDEQKVTNITDSARMIFHPYISEHNNLVYVDMNLGNNGKLSVVPATGIRVSKTVDQYLDGTEDTFLFRISANITGAFDAWITDIGETPEGEADAIVFANGYAMVEFKRNQTLWISGIPAGTEYVVEEISTNKDYKVKSVHVNGTYTGDYGFGTVAQFMMDHVEFVNTAIGEGDLVIRKQVVDREGNTVNIAENIKFTLEVTLKDRHGDPVVGTFQTASGEVTTDSQGKFTVTIAGGHSMVVRGIPEMTTFAVVEKDIPAGFQLVVAESIMTGEIDADNGDTALIINEYTPVSVNGSDINIQVTKEIVGNRTEWLQGESYTFILERLTDARGTGVVIGTKTISDADVNKQALFSLENEVYYSAGTYYYRVTEESGSQGGITYDTGERRFAVVVADTDMDGDLEIVSVENQLNTVVSGAWNVAVQFTNSYAPEGQATVTIEIDKQIAGGHSLNGYQFALYDGNPYSRVDVTEIVKSGLTDAYGNTSITLTYAASSATMAGTTYTYYLAEVNGGTKINNIQYSGQVYEIVVVVKDNGDGTISADLTINGLAQGVANPVFVNEYVPSASDYVVISGQKTTTANRVLNANEFGFVLEAVTAGAPLPAETTVFNSSNGSFSFGAIEFSDAHKGNTYEYIVYESQEDKIGGFDYDDTVYEISVTVTDDGNCVTATTVITDGTNTVEDLIFHNAYDPVDVTVTLAGDKILTGKTLQDSEFNFRIEAVTAGAPLPANSLVTNAANGDIHFGNITYTAAGTYVYRVTEVAGTDSRYDYDTSVYLVTVTVTDDSNGTLNARVTYAKNDLSATGIVFRNGFIPEAVEYDVSTEWAITKALVGRTLRAGEFLFRMENVVTGQQVNGVATNDADGVINFGKVAFTEPGVYHLKITEIIGDETCITYDTSAFHIRVEVTMTPDGILTIASQRAVKETITKEMVGGVLTEVTNFEDLTTNNIEFVNNYITVPARISISGTKILEGRNLKSDEFTFQLLDANGRVVDTTTNMADGTIMFDVVTVESAGTYVYTVVEVEGNDQFITYDDTEFTVVAVVTDNLDGTLSVEYSYGAGNSSVEAIAFTNSYQAAPNQINIFGVKELAGRDLTDGEFTFQLLDEAGNVIGTATNDEDGNFAFDSIEVTEVGTYVYTVVEVEGNDQFITYDDTVYTVTAVVIDNLDGTLSVEYSYRAEEEVTGIKFVNTYKAAASLIEISGEKNLVGRDLTDGEFTFQLLDEAGNVIGTATNDEDGNFVFDGIEVTDVGTYIYTVIEVAGDDDNITYDDTVYNVTVVVTDNYDGTLDLDYTYQAGETEAETITFNNTYEEPEIIIPGQTGSNSMWMWMVAMITAGGALIVSRKQRRA